MKNFIKVHLVVVLACLSINLYAQEITPMLDRAVPFEGGWSDVEVWGQYDYSGKDLDFTGASKSESSYIKQHSNYLAGINFGLYKGLQLRYKFLYSEQDAVRAANPKNINTEYDGHDIRLQYSWSFSPTWLVNVQAGYRNHQVKPLSFLVLDHSGISISYPSGKPVLNIASEDSAYLFGASISKKFTSDMQLTLGLEGRFVDVDANFTSPLLSDSFLSEIVKDEFPQQTPWQEQHMVVTAAFEWHVWKPFSVAMDFKHYQIWRENYQPKAGKQDYNNNQQFDFYLFANVYKGLTLYGHAQIMTHYLLGDVPLAYNTRTNHRFDQVYGFLSGGLTYRF